MTLTDTVRFQSIPLERLRGIGPKTARRLHEKGIRTVEDLLYLCPNSYEDRLTLIPINEAKEGRQCSFVGRIVSSGPVYYRRSRKKGFQAVIEDGTGSISLSWFNFSRPHLETLCSEKGDVFVAGVATRFGARMQIIHPYVAPIKAGQPEDHCRIVPIYPDVQGLSQSIIRKLVTEALRSAEPAGFWDLIPPRLEGKHGIESLRHAMTRLHSPEGIAEPGLLGQARRRLILEEFLSFQAALFMKKRKIKTRGQASNEGKGRLAGQFLASLPFPLTAAQKRVMGEIEDDMARHEPMNRLLQGDVGCGKTLCAIFAACMAIDCGFQVAFLAPTEILAEQHFLSVQSALQPVGVSATLLTASAQQKRGEVLNGLEKGNTLFVVGTHALLEEDVRFSRLGLVIIDEQHKFGVLQRKAIIDKARFPNVLAVTATPIPRTLSIVFYGELDVSIIDEMPSGRRPIKTLLWDDQRRNEAYRLTLDEVMKGGQAYLVFPVIEGNDEEGLRGVRNQSEQLAAGPFQEVGVGMLHGRMPISERDQIITRFRKGEIRILVSTTVIEVGLDVPKATVIVIHHAERFGLAQLHQLRGRVGRGARESVCLLLTGREGTEISRERLRIMEETTDGFRIAEADMMLRGPGEVLGLRQSGLPRFRVGDMVEDAPIMRLARELTEKTIPELTAPEFAAVEGAVLDRWGANLGLMDV